MVLAAQALSYGKSVRLRMLTVFCFVGADLLCLCRSILLSLVHFARAWRNCFSPLLHCLLHPFSASFGLLAHIALPSRLHCRPSFGPWFAVDRRRRRTCPNVLRVQG